MNLEKFDASIGQSDLHLDGRLENFIPYMFRDETIRGNLNMRSHLLDLNALMASTGEDTAAAADTSAMTVFEVPQNINFKLTTNLDKVNYDKLEITNLKGEVTIDKGIMNMHDLSMLLLGGSMTMSGAYNTQDVKVPLLDLDMNMSDIDFPSAFTAFNTVEKLAPVAEIVPGQIQHPASNCQPCSIRR